MSGSRWQRVTLCENIPPREGRAVTVGGRQIAIFNTGERFLATDNTCPHKAGPLCDGIVSGDTIVCPLHAWKIQLDTGIVERPAASNACVTTYATRVEDGIVLIELPPALAEMA
ncbi:MAG: nitrite reductase small subunit NirD [Vicinamibacterales bacterium]|nr:nitrite reductase small subunit NirD [Vicinamibacterales bacterium]